MLMSLRPWLTKNVKKSLCGFDDGLASMPGGAIAEPVGQLVPQVTAGTRGRVASRKPA